MAMLEQPSGICDIISIAWIGPAPKESWSPISRFSFPQGFVYLGAGLWLILRPDLWSSLLAEFLLGEEPYTQNELAMARIIGVLTLTIAYTVFQWSREPSEYYPAHSIAERLFWVTPSMIVLTFVGARPSLAGFIAATDFITGALTYVVWLQTSATAPSGCCELLRRALHPPTTATIHELEPVNQFYVFQALVVYMECLGCVFLFVPSLWSSWVSVWLFHEEAIDEGETGMLRMIGIIYISIGLFYLDWARTNSSFMAAVYIVSRLLFAPGLLVESSLRDSRPSLCLPLFAVDVLLAILTAGVWIMTSRSRYSVAAGVEMSATPLAP